MYTMEYYSAIKRNKCESVELEWLNLEPVIQSEINQKEKNKYHILMHIYPRNLEKWYRLTYLQGRNRATDVENGLMHTTGGEGGMNWESSPDTYVAMRKTDSWWDTAL